MMYFTMRFKNEANKLYYVYVNDDFDRLETLPQLLFQYPDEKISAIDADITRIGDKYHMFLRFTRRGSRYQAGCFGQGKQ